MALRVLYKDVMWYVRESRWEGIPWYRWTVADLKLAVEMAFGRPLGRES
jgi:hypothetical protein